MQNGVGPSHSPCFRHFRSTVVCSVLPHRKEYPGSQVYMAALPALDTLTVPWKGAAGDAQSIQNEEFSIWNRIQLIIMIIHWAMWGGECTRKPSLSTSHPQIEKRTKRKIKNSLDEKCCKFLLSFYISIFSKVYHYLPLFLV